MASEMYLRVPLRVHTDSSAARGIVQRQGAGKVKHLDIKTLWLQERERNGEINVLKVPCLENWSDLLTHHWSEGEAELHLWGMNSVRRGRSGGDGCEAKT